jgi:undecaprenyl-diphosphatase
VNFRFPIARHGAGAVFGLSLFCFCLWGFLDLAEDVPEGQFEKWDEQVLRAFRRADDLGHARGPAWLGDAMRDISALGSPVVLALVIASVMGYLWLSKNRTLSLMVAGSVAGGTVLTAILKSIEGRPRPEIVPHLANVSSSSFPSGHSMLSAVIFLTLGMLLARTEVSAVLRLYLIGLAIVFSFLIGISRVYLGVHYPTDVLAGWSAGVAWTLLCSAFFDRLAPRNRREPP